MVQPQPLVYPFRSKRVIALGDRDGVSGPAIAACAASAGAAVVFVATARYICAAAGAMDPELQTAVLNLARGAASQDLVVVLGQADTAGVNTYARTVRLGDPAHTGALADIALGLPVIHVCDPEFKVQVDPGVWAAQMGMIEGFLDTDALVEAAHPPGHTPPAN